MRRDGLVAEARDWAAAGLARVIPAAGDGAPGDPVRAVRQGRLDGPLPPSPRAQVHEPVEDVRLVPGQQGAGGLPLGEVGQQVLLRVRRLREAVDEVLHVLGSGGSGWSTTRRSASSMREAASGTSILSRTIDFARQGAGPPAPCYGQDSSRLTTPKS